MSFLQNLEQAANGRRDRAPWTAPLVEAQAEFSDLVLITRQGVVDPDRAHAYLADRFEGWQPDQERAH